MTRPLLQIEINMLDVSKALSILEKTENFVDIVAIGNTLIKCEGITLLRILRNKLEKTPILVDTRTMDMAESEVKTFIENGANYITILGEATNQVIDEAVNAAHKYKGKAVVDLVAVKDKIARINELKDMGVDFFHIRASANAASVNDAFGSVREILNAFPKTNFFVSGGINTSSISEVLPLNPSVISVGNGISSSSDPEGVAKTLKDIISSYQN